MKKEKERNKPSVCARGPNPDRIEKEEKKDWA